MWSFASHLCKFVVIVTGGKWFFPCNVFIDRGSTGTIEFPFVHCGYESLFFMSKSLRHSFMSICVAIFHGHAVNAKMVPLNLFAVLH